MTSKNRGWKYYQSKPRPHLLDLDFADLQLTYEQYRKDQTNLLNK